MGRISADERLERFARETFRSHWDSTVLAAAKRQHAAEGTKPPNVVLDSSLATLVHERLALLERRTVELERQALDSEDRSKRWRMGFLLVSVVALGVGMFPWVERGLRIPGAVIELIPTMKAGQATPAPESRDLSF